MQIALHNGVCEHIHVHRGRNDNRAFHGEICCAEHIVGNSVSHLRDDIRRCGRNEHNVSLVSNRNVRYVEHEIAVEGVGHALVFCEGLEGDGIYKIGRVLCHNDVDVGMELNKAAREIRDFIRRDAARYAEYNCFSF